MPSISSLPYTVCCWIQVDSNAAQRSLMWGSAATGNDAIGYQISQSAANFNVSFRADSAVASAGSIAVDGTVWHFCIGGCDSGGNVWIDVDAGTHTGTNTGGTFPGTFDASSIGRRQTGGLEFDGRVAECAMWNIDFGSSSPMIAVLNSGFSPRFVYPNNLVAYVPLTEGTTGTAIDWVTGASYAPTNIPHRPRNPPAQTPDTRGKRRPRWMRARSRWWCSR